MQMPYDDPFGYWVVFYSDLGTGWKSYDDFWSVTSPICDIHWWGLCLNYTDDLYSYDPTGMTFEIQFYADDNGQPGTPLCSYDSVNPSITSTGIMYYYPDGDRYFELYYFETDLDPCCEVSNGWVSIQSTDCPSGGWFMWMSSLDGNKEMYQFYDQWIYRFFDVSFILTDGEPTDPDLECDGGLSWSKVKPGANVTGSFKVRNNGDAGSILNWNISSYPTDWGTNWTFTPKASVLTKDMDWITVDVNVTAPDEKNKEFTGKIKVVNAVDPSDNCEIDVVLKTPKNKAFNFNFHLLNWLFERFPHAFPILRHMLGL